MQLELKFVTEDGKRTSSFMYSYIGETEKLGSAEPWNLDLHKLDFLYPSRVYQSRSHQLFSTAISPGGLRDAILH